MSLLSVEEIQEELEKEFLPLEPMLSGFRLVCNKLQEKNIADTEVKLSMHFPIVFRKLISSFDFGNLTIGPVVFCAKGDYLNELIDLNENVYWWGSGQKPSNLIMIANSDPFAILLDETEGKVLAMDSELGWQKPIVIAKDFYNFIRGVGTVMLRRNNTNDKSQLAQIVHEEVGSQSYEFWFGLAK